MLGLYNAVSASMRSCWSPDQKSLVFCSISLLINIPKIILIRQVKGRKKGEIKRKGGEVLLNPDLTDP